MNQKTFAKNLSKLQKSTESLSVELMRLNKRVVSLTNKTIDLVNLLATELETPERIAPLVGIPINPKTKQFVNLPNRINRDLYAHRDHRITNKELLSLYSDFNLHIVKLTGALKAQGIIAMNSEVMKVGKYSARAYKILDNQKTKE